jgi:hypothetical protein
MVAKPNSIALRIAMVAAGEADLLATIRWGNEWDIAAAVLLASEAGAAVSDAFGRGARFNTPDAHRRSVCSPPHPASMPRRSSDWRTARTKRSASPEARQGRVATAMSAVDGTGSNRPAPVRAPIDFVDHLPSGRWGRARPNCLAQPESSRATCRTACRDRAPSFERIVAASSLSIRGSR